jgi:hypothetical protein
MVHRIYPILGGLALGLAFAAPAHAAAPGGDAPEYSGVMAGGLALRDNSGSAAAEKGRLRFAQAARPDDMGAAAREQLKAELDRIRRHTASERDTAFDPPMPVRKRSSDTVPDSAEAAGQQQPVRAADPLTDRLTGQLLLLNFKGNHPSDTGPKAIRALLQSGLIAGAVFGRENIQSKAQLKELMKFFAATGPARPFFALQEIGGDTDALPPIKDFEQWPSESDVAARGDPQYAYSTYRSMGSSLAVLGFNLNFGPLITAPAGSQTPGASFGADPLQAGVFAKTFILGHREQNVVAVPILDGSLHSVRALKTLLVSDSAVPIGSYLSSGDKAAPFSAYNGLAKGARFCFTALPAASTGAAADGFKRGCDLLVVDGGAGNPSAVRDQVALGLSQALRSGELILDSLNAAAQRANELRALTHSD